MILRSIARSFLILTCTYSVVNVNAIEIVNHTKEKLFIGLYYVKNTARLIDSIYTLPSKGTLTVLRPPRKFLYDREFIVSTDESALLQELPKNAKKNVLVQNIGTLKGSLFHIDKDANGSLHVYTQERWPLRFNLISVPADRFMYEDAEVRLGNDLSEQERAFLAERAPKVKQGLESLLGRSLENSYIPRIAVIASGGGYRAMLGTTGFLSGAHEKGLLNTLTYISALSGSTWAVACWISTGLLMPEFKKYLIEVVAQNKGLASLSSLRAKWIAHNLVTKYAFDLPISLVDFYGGLLANALFSFFGDKRQQIYLSDQAEKIKEGDYPLPIYTAISADRHIRSEWYEFTPYEIGGTWLGMYIPAWAYGRLFANGKSIAYCPEQSFGFHLGTFGSAFAATFREMYEALVHIIPTKLSSVLQYILKVVGQERLSRAKIFNFSYGIEQSPVKELPVLGLVDAGIAFNLPYPPVSEERLERKADILIFFDSSANVKNAAELKKVEQYARSKNFKFPKIDYTDIDKRAISIFKDEADFTVPVVIYMPRIKDENAWQEYKQSALNDDEYIKMLDDFSPKVCVKAGFCNTFNFRYSSEQANKVMLLTEFNMKYSMPKIIDAINWVIDNRQSETEYISE